MLATLGTYTHLPVSLPSLPTTPPHKSSVLRAMRQRSLVGASTHFAHRMRRQARQVSFFGGGLSCGRIVPASPKPLASCTMRSSAARRFVCWAMQLTTPTLHRTTVSLSVCFGPPLRPASLPARHDRGCGTAVCMHHPPSLLLIILLPVRESVYWSD